MPRLKGQLKAKEPLQRVPRYDRCLLYGAAQIAEYIGCTKPTISKWIKKHGFPAAKFPNGGLVTSTALIDLWILSRNPYTPKTPA